MNQFFLASYLKVPCVEIGHYEANCMNEKVKVKKALLAFNTIMTKGQRNGDEYTLNGLTAYKDFDGYTITIRNDYVRLDIFFHNKISFTYSSSKERTLFLEKIETMHQNK